MSLIYRIKFANHFPYDHTRHDVIFTCDVTRCYRNASFVSETSKEEDVLLCVGFPSHNLRKRLVKLLSYKH